MRRIVPLALLCALAIGCGDDPQPTPAADAPTVEESSTSGSSAAEPQERGGSITARLFRRDVGTGTVEPSLEVVSPNASEVEPGFFRVEDTTVTIIGQDDQRTVMTAKVGTLDQNEETAELSVEVKVTMGTMTIATDLLLWDNEKREATAVNGVSIVDGETKMEAKTMRFSPDENTLTLQNVTGQVQLPDTGEMKESRAGAWRTIAMWVVMATPAYAQAASSDYTHVVIEKPAPEVVFRDNRLEHMTGGVEIQLKSANENEPPLLLGAEKIEFGWSEEGETELASLNMKGSVSVANADGEMHSADAAFNVARMRIAFTGGVEGRFEGIDSFNATRLDYNIESGDMEMRNLTATIPFGDTEGGDADGFSNMDVQRAGTVRISESRVQEMRGGVEVTLEPVGGGKPIALRAESFGFSYNSAEQRQPDVVSMSGGVRVDAPQGLIQSDSANFAVARNALKFRGNVRGTNDMMSGFSASSFDYDLDSEDGMLRSFRANGVKFGGDGGYDSMDVRKAPEVRMQGGRVTKMSGGVEIYLEGDAERGSLSANAATIDIEYADASSTAPSAVNMIDDVQVTMGETRILSETADLNMSEEIVLFEGNLRMDDAEQGIRDVTGSRARYDMKTGGFKIFGAVVPEYQHRSSEESPGQP